MAQSQITANKVDQLLINGKLFKDRIAESEKKAVLDSQNQEPEAIKIKKHLKCAWLSESLNRPKLAGTSEAWLKVLKYAVAMQDCVDRDLIINAATKAGQHWEEIARLVIPELNSCSEAEHHVDDGLGWKSLAPTNKKRPREEDDDEDDDDEEEEDEYEDAEEGEDNENDEEEEEEEEEKGLGKADKDEDEEISPCLSKIVQKEKAAPKKTETPARRGRKPVIKEYQVPQEKLVLLNSQASRPERFAVFDLSARKKVHFGADIGLGSLLEWDLSGEK